MAAQNIFNYSKWDKIELSDDESDLHPNIDKDSWFRLKHRTRLEREEKEDQEVANYNKLNAEDNSRLAIIKATIAKSKSGAADEDSQYEDFEALEVEQKDLEGRIATRMKRIEEINERRKWNIDNICKVKDDKSQLNSATTTSLKAADFEPTGVTAKSIENNSKKEKPAEIAKPAPAASAAPAATAAPTATSTTKKASSTSTSVSSAVTPVGPAHPESKFEVLSYNDYVLLHEKLLEEYSVIHDLEQTKNFLFRHCGVLLHEHSQSYMLLSSLEDEMNGKRDRMKLVSRQCQILIHINDLGVSMRRDPRDVILPFFQRIEEKEYLSAFLKAVEDFIKKIQNRAIEKRKEMDAERAEEDEGLDPEIQRVLDSLPTELREAFESQSIEVLQSVLAKMDPAEAKRHMKACVDCGLWVPSDNSIFESQDE
jgi:cell division cycle protein 37